MASPESLFGSSAGGRAIPVEMDFETARIEQDPLNPDLYEVVTSQGMRLVTRAGNIAVIREGLGEPDDEAVAAEVQKQFEESL